MPSHKAGGNWGDVRASERASGVCEQGRRADTEVNFVSLLLSHLRSRAPLPSLIWPCPFLFSSRAQALCSRSGPQFGAFFRST